jgi:hypothetical protein
MNTRSKQDQKKNQREKSSQGHGPKKQAQNPTTIQEHEHLELRLTR